MYVNGITGVTSGLVHVAGERAIEMGCYRHKGKLQLPGSKERSILGLSPSRSPLVVEEAEIFEKVIVVRQRMAVGEIEVCFVPAPPFRLDVDIKLSDKEIARFSLLARRIK